MLSAFEGVWHTGMTPEWIGGLYARRHAFLPARLEACLQKQMDLLLGKG